MTEPYYQDEHVTLYVGDCIDVMRGLPDASVDAVVTDPPYGLEFMGKEWDAPWKDQARASSATVVMADAIGGFQDGSGGNAFSRSRVRTDTRRHGGDMLTANAGFQQWFTEVATEALRVLKPGGHLLAFGGTRTWHRLACAIEDAGFEVRDSIAWMYGSGFPKSLDVSKAIDKAAGAEREVVGNGANFGASKAEDGKQAYGDYAGQWSVTAPATPDARKWQGWGTALKPAFEPVVVARKPLIGTVAENVLRHGTGAINVDGGRIGTEGGGTNCANRDAEGICQGHGNAGRSTAGETIHGPESQGGRWPANVILDESQAAELDRQSGWSQTPAMVTRGASKSGADGATARSGGAMERRDDVPCHGDSGGASRFFYVPKADSSERPRVDGIAHPTVKPVDLMRYLVRLVTPPGGVVLEPFAGSGTTLEACIVEGFRCIGIEREADYLPLIMARITKPIEPVMF